MLCSQCPRSCNALRTERENRGFCRMPEPPVLARAALHFWEEPCISGDKGSGTVFFSGCTLRCRYCQNYEISHDGFGKAVSVERLSEIFASLEKQGAHNINLVSPTHFVHAIKSAVDLHRPGIPLVYNSSGFETTETIDGLRGYADIFLFDLKYLSPDRAEKYSGFRDYPEYAVGAIKRAYENTGGCVFENGLLKSGVIIRHLLLPQGTREAMSVFDWVRENTPDAVFSLMSQYYPCGEAVGDKIIGRPVTKREYDKVTDYLCGFNFEHIYIQERISASKAFIPEFDLTGI